MPVVMCKCGRLFATDRELRVGMCAWCFLAQSGTGHTRVESTPTVTAAAGPQAAPLDPPGQLTKQRRWESRNPEKTRENTRRRVQRYRERQKAGAGM
jgi:hypothetical protein